MTDLASLGFAFDGRGAQQAEQAFAGVAQGAKQVEASVQGAERATDSLALAARGMSATASMQTIALRDQQRVMQATRDATGLARHEMLNLSRQLTDVGVSIASGMPIWMVAIQQGGQIGDTFQQAATRGVGLKAAIGSLMGSVSPMAVGFGLAAGAVGAVGALWLSGERQALDYERAVSGVGRTAGLTAGELKRLAEEGARQGDISISAARKQASAYLSTGRIGGEVLDDLLRLGKDYASFMGVDAADATKQLAAAMQSPDKAAVEMTRSFGLLTQAQISQIDAAMKSGDVTRAQTILLGELDKAISDHAAQTSQITSAWDAVARSIGNAISRLGEFLYLDESERLQQIIDRRASIERGQREYGGPMPARTQGIYDTLGKEGQAILDRRRDFAARQEAAAARAAQNQRAQTIVDNRDTPRSTRRNGPSAEQREYANLLESAREYRDALKIEQDQLGLTSAERGRANAYLKADELLKKSNTEATRALAQEIKSEADALAIMRQDADLKDFKKVDLRPLSVSGPELVNPLRAVADELRLIDDLANDAGRGLSSAFGESGRALGDMLTNLSFYQSRLAEIDLAEREYRLSAAQADRERAHANIQSYGDMTAAARSFFQEGSDGYRILQAAEQGWRLFQLAMSVQAIAQDAAETSTSIANSAARGTAAAASGAARMFEALGPLGFPAVAAMLALLAGLGLSRGGGSRGGSPAVNASLDTAETYTRQDEAARTSFAQTVAQNVHVKVSADRDGLTAYVDDRAGQVAAPMVAKASTQTYQMAAQTIPAAQGRRARQQLPGRIG